MLALNVNSSRCASETLQYSHKFCPRHHLELGKLTELYTNKKNDAENIEMAAQYKRNEDQTTTLITLKKGEIHLRAQVQLRFFSRAADNLGHSQRILLLQSEVRHLEQLTQQPWAGAGSPSSSTDAQAIGSKHAIPSPSSSSTTENLGAEQHPELVHQSRLSQQVPMEALNDLEPDHPLRIVKEFMTTMADDLVNRLIGIAPALDDSPHERASQDDRSAIEQEVGGNIIRTWFRRLVLARGRPDELALAPKNTTIIGFLRSGVEVEELRKYVEYFEDIDVDALRHFRHAVSDTCHARERPQITLLGGSVSTEDIVDELPTRRWDMLFGFFKDIIPGYLLPCLFLTFSNTVHMSKLLLLGRYGQDEGWFPRESALHECQIGTFLGFIPSTQGSCDPPIPRTAAEGYGFLETEYRNYVAGRMSIGSPLAGPFLSELKRRTRLYLVVAWKGANFDEAFYKSKGDLYIRRTRTAGTRGEVPAATWEVQWNLDSVRVDLQRQRSMLGEAYEDYWQFLILDRIPCQPFVLLDGIGDILAYLSDESSPTNTMTGFQYPQHQPVSQDPSIFEAHINSTL